MNLRPALLPALGVFAAAARHQNFAHAAEELHLTASAVSHHVRKLESQLGVALFQRNARGVTLTAEGRQLADAATAALSDIAAVAANLTKARWATLRRKLINVPARIAATGRRLVLHLPTHWPWADAWEALHAVATSPPRTATP